MGVGATIKVIKRFVHPSALLREKYKNPKRGEKLEDCLVIRKEEKLVSRRQQMCIIFRHDDFPNVELHAVERYCQIVKEGADTGWFSNEIDDMVDDVFCTDRSKGVEEIEYEVGEKIEKMRQGGELDINELIQAGLEVEDDNLPLPENITTDSENENGAVYEDWGHSGVCYRKIATGNIDNMPAIKVQTNDVEKYSLLDLFEIFFITDYVKEVILPNINKKITGEKVGYGEFLRWLGIWFLIATVIGPSRDDFFLNRAVDEFSEVPFRGG